LARTYAELEDYKSALEMYQSILDARPQSPDVLSEMAQVLYLSEGSRFTAEVKAMFDRAIQMSPQNVRTISFAGLSAYQSGAYQVALGYWQMAVDISEPNSQQYQYMLQAMEETKRQLTAAGIEPEEKQVAEVESPKLKLNVSLSEGLDLNPNYRVFIYARAWQGPPMPLAVHDVKVADLPLTLTLDESMNPGMPMKLSQFSEWELVARVSQNGTANAQSGDWQASLGPITEDQSDETFRLVITSRIP
jgi:cytochrome c-type biogenesis protein CcmH